MAITTKRTVVLERAAKESADATSKPPFFWEGPAAAARKILDDAQAAPTEKLPVDDAWLTAPADVGDVRVRIVCATAEQLAGLPPAFVIVDEADVLRDEGEAYASRLRAAGVEVTTVRYDGITHDFMMLNPLTKTRAARAAIAQAISILRSALQDT